jgi:hypothetical protein
MTKQELDVIMERRGWALFFSVLAASISFGFLFVLRFWSFEASIAADFSTYLVGSVQSALLFSALACPIVLVFAVVIGMRAEEFVLRRATPSYLWAGLAGAVAGLIPLAILDGCLSLLALATPHYPNYSFWLNTFTGLVGVQVSLAGLIGGCLYRWLVYRGVRI